MVSCPYCKTEIDGDAIVCKNCGQIVQLVFAMQKKASVPVKETTAVKPKKDWRHLYLIGAYLLLVTVVPFFILNNIAYYNITTSYAWSTQIVFLYTIVATPMMEFLVLRHTRINNVILAGIFIFICCSVSTEIIDRFILEKNMETMGERDYELSQRLIFLFPIATTGVSLLGGFLYGLASTRQKLSELFDLKRVIAWITSGDSFIERISKITASTAAMIEGVFLIIRYFSAERV